MPRFSAVAFCSVLALVGTGIGQSFLQFPTLASLWQTSYGKALLVKIALLFAALLLAGREPRAHEAPAPGGRRAPLARAGAARAPAAAGAGRGRLRRGGSVRGSRADEPGAAGEALARVKNVAARVGPGPVSEVVAKGPYKLRVEVTPNRAALPNTFSVAITRNGRPVPGARW